MSNDAFLNKLQAITALATDDETKAEFGQDWTRFTKPNPLAIAFPKSAQDTAQILKLANDHNVAVVPSGGRTGLAGGACAPMGELVISLKHLNHIHSVDKKGATVKAGAGTITQTLHEHVAKQGFFWPIDLAAKGSCTLGGNAATNAGGVRVVRYGNTRAWVYGLQVALMDGRLLDVGGPLEKDNTGLNLKELFIGSEGILGVITEVTLKLLPTPKSAQVMLVPKDSIAQCFALFEKVRRHVVLNAFEYFSQASLQAVLKAHPKSSPFENTEFESANAFALIEFQGDISPLADELVGAVLAQNTQQANLLWSFRENISESLSRRGAVNKNDVSLPLAHIEAFADEVATLFQKRFQWAELFVYGHLGDGNLHLNVPIPESMNAKTFDEKRAELNDAVYVLVQKFGGSISAEHGVGLLKKHHLHLCRSESEIDIMRQIKKVFDPKGLLNPAKVFDP